jgi:glycosidase
MIAALAAAIVSAQGGTNSPQVQSVEPPGWWAGHSHNPVRLLVTGQNLSGTLPTAPAGFTISNVTASADGRYLFADLSIPAQAAPETVTLRFGAEGQLVEHGFKIYEPLSRAKNFQGFTPDDVIYLAMIDRFSNGDLDNDDPAPSRGLHDRTKPRFYHGGDLQGVIDRLDYLRELGVTAIWLTPWYDNHNRLNHREKYTGSNQLSAHGQPITDYHGYGAVDFYSTEERFGDVAQLRKLVAQAHERGLKVIQDQVANHTGPYHPWVTHPPRPTWFNGTPEKHLENSWQTWTIAATNPPLDKLRSTLDGWFINILPDLNQDDPETATYLIQNSLWWIGITGLDAVRQDTLPYVPRTHWARWTAALKREHPQLTVLGEMWDTDPRLVSFFQGGRARFDGVDSGIEALFDFPLHNAIREVFIQDRPMSQLTRTLEADALYVNPDRLVPFLGLHDTTRFLHESGATPERMRLAFTFLLTTRGTPLIYYGDEIAMRGGRDPDNRRDFPGGWPQDARNAFDASGRTAEESAMYEHVKRLLALRRDLEPLRRGATLNLSVRDKAFAFARHTSNDAVLVALNLSSQPEVFDLSLAELATRNSESMTDRLGALGSVRIADGRIQFTLAPQTSAVLTTTSESRSTSLAHEASK